MDSYERENRIVEVHSSKEPEIGRWLWALQDTRERTLKALSGLSQAVVDWPHEDSESSIATVLYHIAAIEADYIYADVLETPFPSQVSELFPIDIRDEQGHLTQVKGFSLEQHLNRLEIVRGLLLDVYQQMDLNEYRRVRSLEFYDITPEWVLHHLMQHEAEHRSQIGALRLRAEQYLATG